MFPENKKWEYLEDDWMQKQDVIYQMLKGLQMMIKKNRKSVLLIYINKQELFSIQCSIIYNPLLNLL